MKTRPVSTRWRIATLLIFAAVAIAPAAILLDRLFGREVIVVPQRAEQVASLDRNLPVGGDLTADSAVVTARPVRVLLLSERKVVRPVSDPSIALLPVDGPLRPLETQTVFAIARGSILALLAISSLMLVSGKRSIFRASRRLMPCQQRRG